MNTLDHMLGLSEGEYDLLDDHCNINMNKNNVKIINDENSFISSKAAPLTILNANDKIKPRGLRANDSDRNSNCNSPIPGLNRSKMNDSKPKNNNNNNNNNNKIIRVNNSDGVRFNENIKINTINSSNDNNNNNSSIFSPEVAYSDHLTRLAGHTPFVENNNSHDDVQIVGRKYVDMHNFNYDVKWSPQDNSPINNTTFNSTNSKSCIMPNPNVNENSIIHNTQNNVITNSNTNFSPSFMITNNNGYNFNDSVDMNVNTVITSRNTPNNDVNDDHSYNFKSISVDALTCAISPNAVAHTSPNIVDYLEQDEIKKHEESPQVSQRISFKRETPIVVHHVINQSLTPRSVSRSTSAPPTRITNNFNNNSPYSNSPVNASNTSNNETNVQGNGRRISYDDIVCSPYNNQEGNIVRRKIPSTPHPIKHNEFKADVKFLYPNANTNIVCNNVICNNSTNTEGEDTGVSRARPGLGSRKMNKPYTKAKPETITINPQSISYPNPPSAIKVVNPSVSGPDKKQKPFSNITNNTVVINTNVETAVKRSTIIESCDNNKCDENPNDVSIQCPSVRDSDVNCNSDSVNFDDNSSFDDKECLDDLISPNPNPIKTLLNRIPSSNTNLGAASRVPKNTSSCDKLKSSLKQEFDVKAIDLNVTFSEDNLSINESIFEPIFTKVNPVTTADTEKDDVVSSSLSELNTSAAMTCVTTLTLDSFDDADSNSFDIGHKSSTANKNDQKAGPRLNLASKKVNKDDFEDMKEVTMLTTPGEFTTIILEFGNKKTTRQTIFSKATCMRFDPVSSSDCNEENSISDTFQVSPRMLDIPLNSHKSIYVTFAPGSHQEGIYTGVLKIKNGKKSFVLMLRGEARYPIKKQIANNIINESKHQDAKVYDDYDFEISDDEIDIKNIKIDNNNKDNSDDDNEDDNDGPLLGLNLDLARPPDYTKFNDLLSKTPHYSVAANAYDLSNPNTKFSQEDVKKSSRFDTKINQTNTNNHISGSNYDSYSYNNAYPNIKVNDSIAEKVANDLLKVRQKVIKDWLGKENTKRRENRVITSPSISSTSYSNIFSVLSKNSSTYQPTPSNTKGNNGVTYNEITASNINSYNTSCKNINARKYDFTSASKAADTVTSSINTTNSSRKTMYSSLGLKSNYLSNTSNIDSITNPSVALFFRRQSVSFGPVAVGTLARVKVELCNGSDKDVSVLIGDPALPFVLLHNEVHVKARSYVRIPLRFVPVFHNPNGYQAELIAQSTDGQLISKIILSGNTFY